jgi:hypothetical protein
VDDVVSMAQNLYAIEQTQLQRQHRGWTTQKR